MLSSRPGAIYQQDNARPHTARLSQQCLQGYDVLPWPARSPDLSPIEHVCDALGRYHLTEELQWRVIGRLDAGQSQIEVVRGLNLSPSGIHRLWIRHLGGSVKDDQALP
ncbi:uncharacterized protein TNCV_1125261 [Trichonephila clavipes]|nr:uncharacterized protein TNCV_1125261 [Trichonephila clavipes]